MRAIYAKTISVAVLPVALLAACGMLGGSAGGPTKVRDLVEWVERVHVEAELARDEARKALAALGALAAARFEGDPVEAYAALVRAVEASERQAARLRETVEPMKEAAAPVFEQWAADLERFASARLRQRSRQRLTEARRRFEAVVDRVDPALATLEELNRGLRDHVLFLGHDLNADALAAVSSEVRALEDLGRGLDEELEEGLRAARAYVERASLPVAAPPGAAPPGAATPPAPAPRPVDPARSTQGADGDQRDAEGARGDRR